MKTIDPLINRTWQPLPGSRQAEIYLYIRKPDLLSSNSYLIRTAEQILLIDPGAIEEQTRDLCDVIRLCEHEQSRPILIYITHCHLDHVLQAPLIRQKNAGTPAWIAVHEEGAGTLARGDETLSIAELYGIPFPPVTSDFLLMTKRDREGLAPRELCLSPFPAVTLTTERLRTHNGLLLYRQSISIGGGECLHLYQTPGHSPDSLCIQIGELLFIGDLFAAVNPMVAGIPGWNRDDYLLTLEHMPWLIETAGIGLCCPGHGAPLSASDARESFRRLRHETPKLGELEEMNRERMLFTADSALELIDEAEEIFSAIAGRLGYVSYHLEALEEPEAASVCRDLMDMEGIDRCLAEFRGLCGELEQGQLLKIKFVHAVLRIVKKIRKLFDRSRMATVIQPSLLNRAERLLIDFIGVARGIRNPEEFIWTDLARTILQVVRDLQESPHADSSIIDASDQKEDYLAALTARIGYADLFDRTVLEVNCASTLPPVRLAAGRFTDTLSHLLEFLAVRGAGLITISVALDRDSTLIQVTARGESLAAGLGEKKGRSFGRRFRMSGATSFTTEGATFEILYGEA